MTLSEGRVGGHYIIEGLELQKATEMRLEAMGLTQGTRIFLMNKKRNGSVIFRVRGTRLAVGQKISEKIYLISESK